MTEPVTMRDLIRRMQEMRHQLVDAQSELAGTEVTGTAGGGLVTVTMLGSGEVSSVRFDQAAVDLRNATDAIKDVTARRMSAVVGGYDTRAARRGFGQLP